MSVVCMNRYKSGALICSEHWGDDEWGRLCPRARPKVMLGVSTGGGRPSHNSGTGVLPPEKFAKYMLKVVHFRAK